MSDQLWISSIQHVIVAHMVHLESPPIMTSTGPTVDYFDGIGAIICTTCRADVLNWYNGQLQGLWPIATGASGAALLGLLGRGTYVQSPLKAYGLPVRPAHSAERPAQQVALVDDCAFTGATLDSVRELVGLYRLGTVVKELVMLDKRGDHGHR